MVPAIDVHPVLDHCRYSRSITRSDCGEEFLRLANIDLLTPFPYINWLEASGQNLTARIFLDEPTTMDRKCVKYTDRWSTDATRPRICDTSSSSCSFLSSSSRGIGQACAQGQLQMVVRIFAKVTPLAAVIETLAHRAEECRMTVKPSSFVLWVKGG